MKGKTALIGGEILDRENGRWISTPATVILEDGYVSEVAKPTDPAASVDATPVSVDDHLIVPGFLNAHYHSADQLFRSRLARGPLEEWIHPWGVLGSVPDKHILTAVRWAAVELLRSGVTRVLDHFAPLTTSHLVLEALKVYDGTGMQATVAPLVGDRAYSEVPPLGDIEGPAVREVDRLLGNITDIVEAALASGREIVLGPAAPQRCSTQLLFGLGRIATKYGLRMHMHCAETHLHHQTAEILWQQSAVERLHDLGLLGPHLSLAHCVWLSDTDIELLAKTGTAVVYNPSSNVSLGSGLAPVRDMLDAGVSVALGTDGVEASGPASTFRTLRDSLDHSRLREHDPDRWLSSHDVLDMLWCGGRAVFGYGVGQIRKGAPGDLVLLDTTNPAFRPAGSIADQLVFYADSDSIVDVYVNGQSMFKDRRLRSADADTILDQLDEACGVVSRMSSIQPSADYIRRVRGAYAKRCDV